MVGTETDDGGDGAGADTGVGALAYLDIASALLLCEAVGSETDDGGAGTGVVYADGGGA